MKYTRFAIALLAVALTVGGADSATAQTASQPAVVSIQKSDVKKVRLYAPTGTALDIAVIDQSGNSLYQGKIASQDKRGTSLNLVNLPDGRYYLTATNDSFWMSQAFTIQRDAVMVDTQQVTELVKPAVTSYARNKYEIMMPNVNDLTVSIYDRMNDLVFSQSFKQGAAHRFDLTSLPAGNYTFVYGPAEKQFTEQVAIQ